jgi:hypothetical protein
MLRLGMPYTNVNTAFSDFMRDKVNLDSKQSDTAKSSQNWMIGQLEGINSKDSSFPILMSDRTLRYGSFKRKTKHRELDDIDTLFVIPAYGITYAPTFNKENEYRLDVPKGHSLYTYTEQYTDSLSSVKIINKIISGVSGLSHYQRAETKRNGSAAVMKLSSYPWAFDIVPSFYTSPESNNREYYLIPNGNGYWVKTDPRIDQQRITIVNQKHSNAVIPVIRLFKRWANNRWGINIPSYLLESLIVNYYDSMNAKVNYAIDWEFRDILNYLSNQIIFDVADPKAIISNINYLSYQDRLDLADKLRKSHSIALAATSAETIDKDHIKAIQLWKYLLGSDFAN